MPNQFICHLQRASEVFFFPSLCFQLVFIRGKMIGSSFLIRDQTSLSYSGSSESYPLVWQGSPANWILVFGEKKYFHQRMLVDAIEAI